MEIEVKETNRLEDGKHKGKIIEVNFETRGSQEYEYVDVIIDTGKMTVTAGYPATITEDTQLGKLLHRFGVVFNIGDPVDPNKHLIEKNCMFMTITTDKGFPKVLTESVKPV